MVCSARGRWRGNLWAGIIAPLLACGAGGDATSSASAGKPTAPAPSAPAHALASPPAAATETATMLDTTLLVRDQPRTGGIALWGDVVVVRSWPPRALDLATGTTRDIGLPGAGDILGLATAGGVRFALRGAVGGKLALYERAGEAWAERALPPELTYDGKTPLVLEGDGDRLVLWTPVRLFLRAGGTWKASAVEAPPPELRGFATHHIVVGHRLYLGTNKGEWGGVLASLDLASGRWRAEGTETDPVTGLAVDPAGRLWVSRGQSHLGIDAGTLHVLEGDVWRRTTFSVGKLRDDEPLSPGDWNLGDTSFDGVGFGPDGRVYLLTGRLGLVTRDARGGGWRPALGFSAFAYTTGLVIAGTTAVISTFDAGVIAWGLDGTRPPRRATLR
jgi:hypothetical protein